MRSFSIYSTMDGRANVLIRFAIYPLALKVNFATSIIQNEVGIKYRRHIPQHVNGQVIDYLELTIFAKITKSCGKQSRKQFILTSKGPLTR